MNTALDALDPPEKIDDDASVIRYLRAHPEFFARHPRLLADLWLPHEAGTAVSLIERQVTLLRERNISTRKRLAQLVDVAHTNDTLFEKTRRLTLLLLDARTLQEIDRALGVGLLESFGADHVVCHYVAADVREQTAQQTPAQAAQSNPAHKSRSRHLIAHGDVMHLPLARLSSSGNGVTCGAIRADEYHALFGERPGHASATIVAFTLPRLCGLFAIGSRDPQRFTADMGPLFAGYVGDVLARVLERALDAAHEPR